MPLAKGLVLYHKSDITPYLNNSAAKTLSNDEKCYEGDATRIDASLENKSNWIQTSGEEKGTEKSTKFTGENDNSNLQEQVKQDAGHNDSEIVRKISENEISQKLDTKFCSIEVSTLLQISEVEIKHSNLDSKIECASPKNSELAAVNEEGLSETLTESFDATFNARLVSKLQQLSDLSVVADQLFTELIREQDQILIRSQNLATKVVGIWRTVDGEGRPSATRRNSSRKRPLPPARLQSRSLLADKAESTSEKDSVLEVSGALQVNGGSSGRASIDKVDYSDWLDKPLKQSRHDWSGGLQLFGPRTRPEMVQSLYERSELNPNHVILTLKSASYEDQSERFEFSPEVISLFSDEKLQLPTVKEAKVSRVSSDRKKRVLRTPQVSSGEQFVVRPKSMPVLPAGYDTIEDGNRTPTAGSNTDLSLNHSNHSAHTHVEGCSVCAYLDERNYISCTDCLVGNSTSDINKIRYKSGPQLNFYEIDIDMASPIARSPSGNGIASGGEKNGRRRVESRLEGYAPREELGKKGLRGSDRELERSQSWKAVFKRSIRSLFNLNRSRPDLWAEPGEEIEEKRSRSRKSSRKLEKNSKTEAVTRSQSLPRINKGPETKSPVASASSRVKSTSVEDQLHIKHSSKMNPKSQAILQTVLTREQQKATVSSAGGTRMGRSLSALTSKAPSDSRGYPAMRPSSMEVGVPVFNESGRLIGCTNMMDSSAGSLSSDSTLVDERGSGRVVHVDVPGPYTCARLRHPVHYREGMDTSREQSSSGHWSGGSSMTERRSTDSDSLRLSYPHQHSVRASLASLEELRKYSDRSPSFNTGSNPLQLCSSCRASGARQACASCAACTKNLSTGAPKGFSTFRSINLFNPSQTSTTAVSNWLEANHQYTTGSTSSNGRPGGQGSQGRLARRAMESGSDSDDSDEALEQLTDTRNPAALQRSRSAKRRRQQEEEGEGDMERRGRVGRGGVERKGSFLGRLLRRSFRGKNPRLDREAEGNDDACLTPQLPRSKAMELARLSALAEKLAEKKADEGALFHASNGSISMPTRTTVTAEMHQSRQHDNSLDNVPSTYYRYPSCDGGIPGLQRAQSDTRVRLKSAPAIYSVDKPRATQSSYSIDKPLQVCVEESHNTTNASRGNCDCGSPLRSPLESILETSMELEDSIKLQRKFAVGGGSQENFSTLRRDSNGGSQDSIDDLMNLVPGSNNSMKRKSKLNRIRSAALSQPTSSMTNNYSTMPDKYRPQMIVKPKFRINADSGSMERFKNDRPLSEVKSLDRKTSDVSMKALDDTVRNDFISKLASYAIGADSMSTMSLDDDDNVKSSIRWDDSKSDLADSILKLNLSNAPFTSSASVERSAIPYSTAFALRTSINGSTNPNSSVLPASSSFSSRPNNNILSSSSFSSSRANNIVPVAPLANSATSVSRSYSSDFNAKSTDFRLNNSKSTANDFKLNNTKAATSSNTQSSTLNDLKDCVDSLDRLVSESYPNSPVGNNNGKTEQDFKCDSGVASLQTSLLEVGSSVDAPSSASSLEGDIKLRTKINSQLNSDYKKEYEGLKPAPARLIISSPISDKAEFVENSHKRLLCSPVTAKDFANLKDEFADSTSPVSSEETVATRYPTISKTLGFPVVIDRKINASNYGRTWYD